MTIGLPSESTPLSCSLADQGIKIRIRKDIRVRKRPIAALAAPIDTENNNNHEEDHENGTPLSAAPSSAGHSMSKRPRHATVSSNGAPDLQTPTASLVGLPAWPSTSLDPMLGAPSAPGGVELPAPTHPTPAVTGIPPPRSASYETSRIPPPPGAQMIAGASYESPRSAQPIQPATSQRQAPAMPPPAPFPNSAPAFNSQNRVGYEPSRPSTFDTRTTYESQRAPFERGYEQAERGYDNPRPAPTYERAPFDAPRNTAYASGYEGQNANPNATAFQEPYSSYSGQPSTSSQYPHPSSPSSSSASSAYPPSSRFGSAYPYSQAQAQAQSRYEYPHGSQPQQQYASPNGDSYYDSSTSGPASSSHSHTQSTYYPSPQPNAPTNSWSTTPTSASAQSYSSSNTHTHTQSYEYNNHPQPQPYPNSEYYQHPHHQPPSSQGQGHSGRVTSPAPVPSRYANASQGYSNSGGSNEPPYARHPHPAYNHPPPSSSQHQQPPHEWSAPGSTWNANNNPSVGDQGHAQGQGQGLIQLAPLRRHPSSTSTRPHQHAHAHTHHHVSASSASPVSSDASSPVGGTPVGGVSLAGNVGGVGAGGGGVIQLPRAPFEHDARVQGKKNVLSIGSIISGV